MFLLQQKHVFYLVKSEQPISGLSGGNVFSSHQMQFMSFFVGLGIIHYQTSYCRFTFIPHKTIYA